MQIPHHAAGVLLSPVPLARQRRPREPACRQQIDERLRCTAHRSVNLPRDLLQRRVLHDVHDLSGMGQVMRMERGHHGGSEPASRHEVYTEELVPHTKHYQPPRSDRVTHSAAMQVLVPEAICCSRRGHEATIAPTLHSYPHQ